MNNIAARYNLIDTKYHQMAFQSPSDGAPISPNQPSFGIPGQTKVSGDRQWETTHEICCLTAECSDCDSRVKLKITLNWKNRTIYFENIINWGLKFGNKIDQFDRKFNNEYKI